MRGWLNYGVSNLSSTNSNVFRHKIEKMVESKLKMGRYLGQIIAFLKFILKKKAYEGIIEAEKPINFKIGTVPASVAVIYIARGQSEVEKEAIAEFAESYRRHESGQIHNLHVIFKGFENQTDLDSAMNLFSNIKHQEHFYADKGFDITAYINVANKITEQYVFFLNTHSRIEVNNWLRLVTSKFAVGQVGLIGCTSSYNYLNFSKYPTPEFPNPHIRTNAFLIERSLFLKITAQVKIRDKEDAWNFESGLNSMTRKIAQMNLRVIVVNKFGRSFTVEKWQSSGTFLSGAKNASIISDNHTRHYDEAPKIEKLKLEFSAWQQNSKKLPLIWANNKNAAKPLISKVSPSIASDCLIVIPFHKVKPDKEEAASLTNTLKIFANRDILILLPARVNKSYYLRKSKGHKSVRVVNLPKGFLGSIENYNNLFLNPRLYASFDKYLYICITHLDAWIFRDELSEWISADYDYVGSPLFLALRSKFPTYKSPIHKIRRSIFPFGGNGGYCLRKVSSTQEMLTHPNKKLAFRKFIILIVFFIRRRQFFYLFHFIRLLSIYMKHPSIFREKYKIFEDVMISIVLNLFENKFKVAKPSETIKFGADSPYLPYFIYGSSIFRLPSGLHGFKGQLKVSQLTSLTSLPRLEQNKTP